MNNFLLPNARRTYGKPFDCRRLRRDIAWKLDIAAKQKKLSQEFSKNRIALTECPVCQSKDFSLFAEIFDYPYVECSSCGHIFSQKPPVAQNVQDLYTSSDKTKKAVQAEIYVDKELFLTRVKEIALPKVKYVTERLPGKGGWVDVGCGVGEIVLAAKNLGWDATGVESDKTETDFAKEMGINLVNTLITEENAGKYAADAAVISLFNVLEHIASPVDLVKSLAKSAAYGCNFVFEIPRHPSLSSFTNRAFPEMACRHIYPPDHLHIFTEQSINIILEKAGLAAEHIWLFGQDFYEAVSSISVLNKASEDRLMDLILNSSNGIQEKIDQSNLSDIMILIAKKVKK